MSVSLQDLVKGIDFTGLTGINAGDMNQLVDNSAPASDKGLIVVTSDTAAYVPDVPDAITNTKFQRYIWIRRLHADDASNNKVRIYAWNPTIDADDTYSQWEQIRGVVDIDLIDIQDFPYLANFGLEQASNSRYTVRISVHTIADLKALNTSYITYGVVCYVMGYSETNDGGEGLFVYDSTSTATEDIGLVLAPSSNSGRWLRIVNCNERRAEWFGAKGDGVTDDSTAIQACINSCNRVDLMAKTYVIGTWLMPTTGLVFRGENKRTTTLKLIDNIHTIHPELFLTTATRWYGMLSESAFSGGRITNNVLVENILFDANYRGQAAGYKLTNDCIRLRGSCNVVNNCAFTDFSSGSADFENFIVNLGINPTAVEASDRIGGKVFHCDFYGAANNSDAFSSGGYVPEITLICVNGHAAPDDLSVEGTPSAIWAYGVEIAHCRFLNLTHDDSTQYQTFHCITTSSCDGANIHDNYAINVDGAGYYEDSWHTQNISIKNNVFLYVNAGIQFSSGGVVVSGGSSYLHRIFGAHIENNTIIAKAATANITYSTTAPCLHMYSSASGRNQFINIIVQNNHFKAVSNIVSDATSIEHNTGFLYIVRSTDTAANYITYHGVKYYNGETFASVYGDTTFTATGDAKVDKIKGSQGVLFHLGSLVLKNCIVQDNYIDCIFPDKGMMDLTINNYLTFYSLYFIGGYNAYADDATCLQIGRNRNSLGEILRCALASITSGGAISESLSLESNCNVAWTIPYYAIPKNRTHLTYVKDLGAFNAASDEYFRGRAIYIANDVPRYIPSGQLQIGLTYVVEADTAAGNSITYNGTTYTNGQRFMCVYGVNTYTKTGKALVKCCVLDCYTPISFNKDIPIEDVSGNRSGTHGDVKSTFTLDGYTNLKKGLSGIVRVTFSDENAAKVINLPAPINYIGRTFKLCLVMTKTAAEQTVKLKYVDGISKLLVNNATQAVTNEVQVSTTSTTVTKAIMIDVTSDGAYWYITL